MKSMNATPRFFPRSIALVAQLGLYATCAGANDSSTSDPRLTSWIINTTKLAAHSFDPDVQTCIEGITADIEAIYVDDDFVYVECSGLPAYPVGPFNMNPNTPTDRNYRFRIPRLPACAYPSCECGTPGGCDSPAGCETEPTCTTPADCECAVQLRLGAIGVWVNGVPVFSPWDDHTAGDCYWHRNAVFAEADAFDAALGHPAPDPAAPGPCASGLAQGIYHHHQWSPALAELLCIREDEHSPIVGWAFDGHPIYGPFAYANPDGTGGITRMRSSYALPSPAPMNRTTTASGSPLPNVNYGPPFTADPQGWYFEDYIYTAGLGHLDERNGRCCVTPDYPDGVYAYFVTTNDLGDNEFPYTIGSRYNSQPEPSNFLPIQPSIPASAKRYDSNPCQQSEWNLRKLLADNYPPDNFAAFGHDVAIEGDTALVGAPSQSIGSATGAIFNFEFDGWDWLHHGELTGPLSTGFAVELEAGVGVAGAPSDGLFGQAAPLNANPMGFYSALPLIGTSGDDWGRSVAIEGDTVVVGAPNAQSGGDAIGAIEFFDRAGPSTWALESFFFGDDIDSQFGVSLAIDDQRVVVGSPSLIREAYVYERVGMPSPVWARVATLAPRCPTDPNFGASVAICGDIIAVGSPGAGTHYSYVYVYRNTLGSWNLEQTLAGPREGYGSAVAINDDLLLVGTPRTSTDPDDPVSGSVFVYEYCDHHWVLTERLEGDGGPFDRFGVAVDLDGDFAIIGADFDDELAADAGAAYICKRARLFSVTSLDDFGGLSGVSDIFDELGGDSACGVARRAGVDIPVLWREQSDGAWLLIDLSMGQQSAGRANRLAESAGGLLVAGAITGGDSQLHATIWDESSGWQPQTLPQPAGTTSSEGWTILVPPDGTVICAGTATTAGGLTRPALWINGAPIGLAGLAPTNEGVATDVVELPSGELLVVGWATNIQGSRRPVRWRQNGQSFDIAVFPGLPNSARGAAMDIDQNADGSLVVAGEVGPPGATSAVTWSLAGETWNIMALAAPRGATSATLMRIRATADPMQMAVGNVTTASGVEGFIGWIGCGFVPNILGDITVNQQFIVRSANCVTAARRIGGSATPAASPSGPARAVVLSPYFPPLIVPGDMNCDGNVDNFDIDPFVLALTSPAEYESVFPYCNLNNGDINGDGAFNNFDIDPFVQCLVSECP